MAKSTRKIEKVINEFKSGTLHSGSKKGPVVTNHKQAVAIALSEQRGASNVAPPKGKVPPQFLPGYKKKTAPGVSGAPATAPVSANPMKPVKQKSLFKKHPVGGYNM